MALWFGIAGMVGILYCVVVWCDMAREVYALGVEVWLRGSGVV